MIEIRVPARLEYLGLLRQGVLLVGDLLARQELTVAPEVVSGWALAVYEAATNVARHGYAGGSDEVLTLSIRLEPGQVVFELDDGGHPNEAWERETQDEPGQDGGYGLAIIRRVMSEVAYDPGNTDRNRLRMVALVPRVIPSS